MKDKVKFFSDCCNSTTFQNEFKLIFMFSLELYFSPRELERGVALKSFKQSV